MEKKIIITGTAKVIDNIMRENRIRESRGDIRFGECIRKTRKRDESSVTVEKGTAAAGKDDQDQKGSAE